MIEGRHEIGDALDLIHRGMAQLWTDKDAAAVTEIVTYARRKALRCWLAAGDFEGIRRIEDRAIPWAKHYGCEEIEIVGRLGWRRRLSDYTERAVVMTKEI